MATERARHAAAAIWQSVTSLYRGMDLIGTQLKDRTARSVRRPTSLRFEPLEARSLLSALPAFPGAEGFGAASEGGRGGRVFHVTTLEPTGPGSINEATQASGPRTVVFDVSGVIKGDVLIKDGNLTIAGQTAPGGGITIEGRLRSQYSNWDLPADDPNRFMYHDLIIRHIRVRPPQPGGINGDCIQLSDWDRVILDHVSVAWGNDENIDLCASRDVTVQWSTIEESDNHYWPEGDPRHGEGTHNYGMIFGYEGKNISVHHNLFAHHMMRTPLNGAEPLDHRNNVIYDVDQGLSFHPQRMNRSRPGEPIAANVIGNYFIEGPSALKNGIDTYVNPAIDTKYSWIYAAGNYFDYLN
ncbi:MAG: hypothetical protein KJZ78_22945, partial [Bryobacteraceae bacterium]|nr:hypothetical protein [Bryobacteraceae bacterium]